jgi:hypothetical protein
MSQRMFQHETRAYLMIGTNKRMVYSSWIGEFRIKRPAPTSTSSYIRTPAAMRFIVPPSTLQSAPHIVVDPSRARDFETSLHTGNTGYWNHLNPQDAYCCSHRRSTTPLLICLPTFSSCLEQRKQQDRKVVNKQSTAAPAAQQKNKTTQQLPTKTVTSLSHDQALMNLQQSNTIVKTMLDATFGCMTFLR